MSSSHQGSRVATPVSQQSRSSIGTVAERLKDIVRSRLWTPCSAATSGPTTEPSWKGRATRSIRLEDPSLLRGMCVAYLLRNFASVLRSNTSNPKDYERSMPVSEIDVFVSHVWSCPRWKKFLVLVFDFNLIPSLLISTVVAAGACALTVQGIFPTVTVVSVMDPETSYSSGVCCMPIGLAVFFISLFTVHELNWCYLLRGQTVFLDKTCVNQADLRLKKKGIDSLAAFLKHSRHMLVLWSDQHMKRLWTSYEVASWLLLHRGEEMRFRPLFAPMLVLCGCCCFLALEATHLIVQSTSPSPLTYAEVTTTALHFLAMYPAFAGVACMGKHWAGAREKFERRVENFTLAELQCSNEEDRPIVYKNIVAFMKLAELSESDATDTQALESFQAMVRQRVPALMWSSFGSAGIPYVWTVVLFFPHALMALDIMAGLFVDAENLRYIVLWSLQQFVEALAGGPLLVVLSFALTRVSRFRSVLGCLGVGALATALVVASHLMFAMLTEYAQSSNGWLSVLLGLDLLLVATTVFFYSPTRHAGGGCAVED